MCCLGATSLITNDPLDPETTVTAEYDGRYWTSAPSELKYAFTHTMGAINPWDTGRWWPDGYVRLPGLLERPIDFESLQRSTALADEVRPVKLVDVRAYKRSRSEP